MRFYNVVLYCIIYKIYIKICLITFCELNFNTYHMSKALPSSSKNISVLIDVMSDTSDIELKFE